MERIPRGMLASEESELAASLAPVFFVTILSLFALGKSDVNLCFIFLILRHPDKGSFSSKITIPNRNRAHSKTLLGY